MALKVSTGLRNSILVTGSLRGALTGGFLKLYSGTVPGSADDSLGAAQLLCTISLSSGGTGITLDSVASSGSVSKPSGATWSGVNALTGVPTFYRYVTSADDGTSSTTQVRLQGTVGTTGTDLILANGTLTATQTTTIDSYSVSIPAS